MAFVTGVTGASQRPWRWCASPTPSASPTETRYKASCRYERARYAVRSMRSTETTRMWGSSPRAQRESGLSSSARGSSRQGGRRG